MRALSWTDYTLGTTYFNKMSHQQLKLEECERADGSHFGVQHPGREPFLFGDPALAHLGQLSKKDALTLEHLAYMNLAFCEFYAERANCTRLPAACGSPADGYAGSTFNRWLREIEPALQKCVDEHTSCVDWAHAGECEKNPLFMHSGCAVSCGSCAKPIDELFPEDLYRGDWKREQRTPSARRSGRRCARCVLGNASALPRTPRGQSEGSPLLACRAWQVRRIA